MSLEELEQITFNYAYDAFTESVGDVKYKVFSYLDERDVKSINILSCFDTLFEGVTSFSTLGLSHLPARMTSDGKPLTVELVSACDSVYDQFPNMISTCAFQIMDGLSDYGPGAVVPNVVPMYYPDLDMKHMLMGYPFLWGDTLHTISVKNDSKKGILRRHSADEKLVAWLELIPISEMEYQYLLKNGYDALEDLFEKNEIDVLNLERKCVLA